MRSRYARRLVVMVKEPRAGVVKTRLAKGTSASFAVNFYRATTAAVLSRAIRPRAWETILAVTPDGAIQSRAWHRAPRGLRRVPQGRGDLGQRMQRVMDRMGPGPVLIIGSDIPGIRAGLIREAFQALGANDAVLGPCQDGGYWLIGLKRFPRVPRAFGQVRWSTSHALADTLANLAGHRIAFAASLDDVDEAADLAPFHGAWGRRL